MSIMQNYNLLANMFAEHFKNQQPQLTQQEIIEEQHPIPKKIKFLTAKELFDDMYPSILANEFHGLAYIGGMGQGKTSSAEEVVTHAKEKGFLIIYCKIEDVMDIDDMTPKEKKQRGPDKMTIWKEAVKQKIKEHGRKEICFITDDMSYGTGMVSTKKSSQWKHFVGDIRHQFSNVLGEGIKPKVFLVSISHRYHSTPPIMRNASSWIFASMKAEDRLDAQKILPKNKEIFQRLDEFYSFMQEVTAEGPKTGMVKLSLHGVTQDFAWGNKENPGDGRIMVIYHEGELLLYNPKTPENRIDLEKCRIKLTPDVVTEILEKKEQDFRSEAEKMFSTPQDDDKAFVIDYTKEDNTL